MDRNSWRGRYSQGVNECRRVCGVGRKEEYSIFQDPMLELVGHHRDSIAVTAISCPHFIVIRCSTDLCGHCIADRCHVLPRKTIFPMMIIGYSQF